MFDFLTTVGSFLVDTGKKIIVGPSSKDVDEYEGSDLAAGFIKKGAKAFLSGKDQDIPTPPPIPEIGAYKDYLKRPTTTQGAQPVRLVGTNNPLFQQRVSGLSSSVNPDVLELLRQNGISPNLQQGRRTLGLESPTNKRRV